MYYLSWFQSRSRLKMERLLGCYNDLDNQFTIIKRKFETGFARTARNMFLQFLKTLYKMVIAVMALSNFLYKNIFDLF